MIREQFLDAPAGTVLAEKVTTNDPLRDWWVSSRLEGTGVRSRPQALGVLLPQTPDGGQEGTCGQRDSPQDYLVGY